MNTFDLTPLVRTSVGFDRLMQIVDSAMRSDGSSESYPPYNIEQTSDDAYRITLAVAGFKEGDLNMTIQDNTLIITGKTHKGKSESKYLYRGIAGRAFEKQFQLADFIKIGNATLADGLLCVELIREIPEAMKPRSIKIHSKNDSQTLIEQQ